MEKVLSILKGFLAGFVDLLFHPVTKVSEMVQKENIKKGAIKAAVLALVLSITNVLATIRTLHITYTSSKIRSVYIEALNPMLAILKTFGINLLIIAAISLVLFIISKIVKDQKSFPYTLSMTVNSGAVFAVASVLGLIFSFWTPLTMFVITLGVLHSAITLLVTFMSSLSNVNTDQLVIVAAVVLLIVSVAMFVIRVITKDLKFNGYADSLYRSKYTQQADIELSKKQLEKAYSVDSVSDALNTLSSISDLY